MLIMDRHRYISLGALISLLRLKEAQLCRAPRKEEVPKIRRHSTRRSATNDQGLMPMKRDKGVRSRGRVDVVIGPVHSAPCSLGSRMGTSRHQWHR